MKPMQSAERRRCNQRELPAKPGARWRTGKEGSPAGRKPERLSPSGWKHCVQWKFCIPSRVLRQFCMLNSTLSRKQYSIPQRNLLRRCKIIVEKGCFKRKMRLLLLQQPPEFIWIIIRAGRPVHRKSSPSEPGCRSMRSGHCAYHFRYDNGKRSLSRGYPARCPA